MNQILSRIVLASLKGYRLLISPWLSPCCRFMPTCSEFASEAIEKFGVIRGSLMTIRRLLRCHPFCRGGWDPV